MTTPIDEAAKAVQEATEQGVKLHLTDGYALNIAQAAIQAHTAAVLRGTKAEGLVALLKELKPDVPITGDWWRWKAIDGAIALISAQAIALAEERARVAELTRQRNEVWDDASYHDLAKSGGVHPEYADGWVEWGGDGRQPVKDDVLVHVRFRSGEGTDEPLPAGRVYWPHDDQRCDIIAYKLAETPALAQTEDDGK